MSSRFAVVSLAAVLLVASACDADDRDDGDQAVVPDSRRDGPPPSTEGGIAALDWRACRGGECAELTVPRDYDDGQGPTIDVALFRIPAGDPGRRIGSLLVNPGGPGAPGVEFVRESGSFFPDELRERFDLVGFDPRGTGDTIPVDCVDSLDAVLDLDYEPEGDEERAALEAAAGDFGRACQQRSGALLPHIASQDTVRDMDRVRAALGEERLTYLGYSYGTYLGALYAELFPDRVRALVLDGAVDPALSSLEASKQQAAGFEQALQAFLDDCADAGCDFHGDDDPGAVYDALVEQVDRAPVPAGDGRSLGPNELDLAVANHLYLGELGWDALDEGLAAALDGDGEELLESFDEYAGRRDDGTYGGILEAFFAIGCVDAPSLGPPEGYPALEAEFAAASPHFGVGFLYSGLVCSSWPVPPVSGPGSIRGAGAAAILVIGTTGDPATPLAWAESLASQLDSGVLLTAEGTQHTSAFLGLNRCVDEAALAYLVDLVVPPDGERCGEE